MGGVEDDMREGMCLPGRGTLELVPDDGPGREQRHSLACHLRLFVKRFLARDGHPRRWQLRMPTLANVGWEVNDHCKRRSRRGGASSVRESHHRAQCAIVEAQPHEAPALRRFAQHHPMLAR